MFSKNINTYILLLLAYFINSIPLVLIEKFRFKSSREIGQNGLARLAFPPQQLYKKVGPFLYFPPFRRWRRRRRVVLRDLPHSSAIASLWRRMIWKPSKPLFPITKNVHSTITLTLLVVACPNRLSLFNTQTLPQYHISLPEPAKLIWQTYMDYNNHGDHQLTHPIEE